MSVCVPVSAYNQKMFHSLTITRPPPQSVIKDSFCFGRAPEMNPMWCLFAFATWLAWTEEEMSTASKKKKRKEKKRKGLRQKKC